MSGRGQAGRCAAFGLVLALALVGLSAHLAPGDAQTLFGVVRVVDGDTIHVRGSETAWRRCATSA